MTGMVTRKMDFPLAPRRTQWDRDRAEAAVRVETGAVDAPNAAYAGCFFWHDAAAGRYDSYELLYCDVVEGEIKAVPRAIFAVAGLLEGARGGTTIPRADQEAIKAVVAEWYAEMADEFGDASIVVPWAGRNSRFWRTR